MNYVSGCLQRIGLNWILSWFSPAQIPSTKKIDSVTTSEHVSTETLQLFLAIIGNKLSFGSLSTEEYIHGLLQAKDVDRFKLLLLRMWRAPDRMYVEILRCLEPDICHYFGVDPSFKRLCFKISHYLDMEILTYFYFPVDQPFIESRAHTRALWTIIGLWILDGEQGLKTFVSVLTENEYGAAIECIRRERCRDLFGVPRIPPYQITEDGFVLSQTIPDRPKQRFPTLDRATSLSQSLPSSNLPTLHSSLLGGLPQ